MSKIVSKRDFIFGVIDYVNNFWIGQMPSRSMKRFAMSVAVNTISSTIKKDESRIDTFMNDIYDKIPFLKHACVFTERDEIDIDTVYDICNMSVGEGFDVSIPKMDIKFAMNADDIRYIYESILSVADDSRIHPKNLKE